MSPGALLVAGTTSDAGKGVLVIVLCLERIAADHVAGRGMKGALSGPVA